MTQNSQKTLQKQLEARFSDAPPVDTSIESLALLHTMSGRGSCRAFLDKPVSLDLIQTLCALALCSPSKSDLQQRDIVLLKSTETRSKLARLVSGQAWVAEAPMIVVFCGNNRRQRLLHDLHGVTFANDHLDAFFNAAGDAAIALGAFVTAAEALGLGCCPISAVRNDAEAVSELLDLPKHVFPFAGLAFGYPAETPTISKRLPLHVTCHVDRYQEANLPEAITRYDSERAAAKPTETQRLPEKFGISDTYTWSEDKVRQYSEPERSGFGQYVRDQGFSLD